MSPAPSPIRLATEARRAVVGLWLVVASVLVAPPLYHWLDTRYHDLPGLTLASAIVLATLACVGLGSLVAAGLRALTAAISSAGTAPVP